MTVETPAAHLDERFSSADAKPIAWAEAKRRLENAELYWVTTVRPDGRPHVTPLIAVWVDEALYFCTGADERKNRNIDRNSQVLLTTGCNTLHEGLDIVVEGDAVRISDEARLQHIADGFFSKYGDEWRFRVRDGAFYHDTGSIRETDTGGALVYEVRPKTALGFGKGEPYSQTRWRF
jgi:nitroimidazol reductase NimA-like FMN-containing flavoprotein (pyridoxamine 5'-phosphate oxidase superfamily)